MYIYRRLLLYNVLGVSNLTNDILISLAKTFPLCFSITLFFPSSCSPPPPPLSSFSSSSLLSPSFLSSFLPLFCVYFLPTLSFCPYPSTLFSSIFLLPISSLPFFLCLSSPFLCHDILRSVVVTYSTFSPFNIT